jgi:hypothetical protein
MTNWPTLGVVAIFAITYIFLLVVPRDRLAHPLRRVGLFLCLPLFLCPLTC